MMRKLALLVVVCLVLPSTVADAGGIPTGPNVQVTDSGLGDLDDAETAEIAIQGGSLYATWLDTRFGSSTRQSIYFARSDDSGASWGTNVPASLLSRNGFNDRPVISVAPDGSIWIAWWLRRCFAIDPGDCGDVDRYNDTFLALSTDGGATFGEYLAFDGTDDLEDFRGYPEIYAANDRTLLLTNQPSGAGADVIVRVLRRTGPTTLAAATVPVSTSGGNGRVTDDIIDDGPRMSLAVRENTVCAAWEDRRERFAIFGACSTDGGQTFGANFQISGSDDFNPRLAFAPDGTLYATYQDVEGGPLLIRRSSDNGAKWDAANTTFAVDDSLDIDSYDLDVDLSGQVIVTVAPRSGTGISSSSNLYLATSIDRGQRFSLVGPLEDDQGEYPTTSTQFNPRTVIGSGPQGARAFVIWSDDRNIHDQIWTTRVDLDGTPPSAPPNLRVQSGDTTALLSWDAASDANGIAGYHVQRATSEAGPFSQITPRLVTGTNYRDVGLATTRYFYRVYAVDRTGNLGPFSNTANVAATAGSGFAGLEGTIAYQAAGRVAVRSFADGSLGEQRVLGEGYWPTFSHDGQRLLSLFTANGDTSVQSRSPDGGEVSTLYAADGLLNSLDTTADPNVIATAFWQFYAGAQLCQAVEPRIVSLQPFLDIYDVSSAIATDLSVSSDRSFIAYTYTAWCNGVASGVYDTPRLCIENTATGAESCLDGANVEDSDFVPNRATIVLSADFTGQRELWRADVQPDGSLVNLAQLTRGPAGQPALAPRVSTDGNWVIFVRDTDPGQDENPVLHVVRLDGEGLRSLGITASTPTWAGGGARASGPEHNRVWLPLVRRP